MEPPQTQTQTQPPLPPLPHRRRNSSPTSSSSASSSPRRRLPSDIVLPEWQPDESVTRCPICHNAFTFFNRRHHCRKCGRVVCNPCSPHRITIPKAFVVRPAIEASFCQPLHSPSSYASSPRLGDEDDGLQVRICDHCLGRRSPDSPANWMSGFLGGEHTAGVGVAGSPRDAANARRRRGSIQIGRSLPHVHHSSSTFINYQSPPQSHHFPSSSSLPTRRPQPQHAHHSRHSSHQLPRPSLAETDFCPICTHPLPPRSPSGSEDARESHIQSCILAAEASPSASSPLPARVRRHTTGGRMVVWIASEKDAWANEAEGERAECVICFEEFLPGNVVARLECLCRYHKKCISDWFAKKGSGECPIHAVHD